ncbi:NAD(P)H-binding protein [Pseudoxanthomonas wuyuanensis]|uniref:NAD(P)H dehydrogenase (Quinone) n=1 Tax=Pseudoxanthomonas wuyuanensis TaxID=1073196 RepID=A0A286CXT7_9GAMM|nr:NAD(P)H-binding protein [Pseudoxanthomonas wuyuanensis]KAF1722628.1 NAD(P)-dependent oxidoreductase [Pseudoxanthomonas wuyuanensis]SOD51200.1 NAD(P)H dehydrogenase (quinone) [Pseudoxanthomonas wuyuanensis]
MNANAPTLLVTGASGHFGRAAVTHLLDTLQIPAGRIIATSRKPEALADLAARGVTVRAADFDDPASLQTAFAGADRLLLVSTDALLEPGKRLAQHRAAVHAAAQAGVKHVAYTSLPSADSSRISFAPDHFGTEQALAASPLGWTVLRNAWYFENLAYSVPGALAGGQWFSAAGEGRIAYIARDDLARAAAATLASGETANRTLTLTGTQAFNAREVAARVAAAAGKPLEVIDVNVEQLKEGLLAHGFPPALAEVFASFDVATAAGDLGQITDDYAALTGRTPQTFEDWLARNGASLFAA